MKITLKLTILFTIITAGILFLFAAIIYQYAKLDREEEFFDRIEIKARVKGELLFEAKASAKTLQDIHFNNLKVMNEAEIAVYDDNFNLVFHDDKENDIIKETPELIRKTIKTGEVQFYIGTWQAIAIRYPFEGKNYVITAVSYDHYGYNKIENMYTHMVYSYIAAIVVICFSGLFFSIRAFAPVTQITRKVNRITANKLDVRLDVNGSKDELSALALTFNQMLDRLQHSFEGQKSFVSNISHELRTPLADPYTDASSAPQLNKAVFNKDAAHQMFSGYFKWQFLDKESNDTPFAAGTYLGKKSVFNIGIGAEYMKDALWHTDGSGTNMHDAMKNFAVDVFYDVPINRDRGSSFSAYAVALKNDYGPNYVKVVGTNNPATGVDATSGTFSGAGNAYPLMGTGNTYYAQVGGTLPYFNQEKKGMQLMPAASVQYSNLDALADPVVVYDAGVSLLLNGHASKFTFDAQRRPVFGGVTDNMPSVSGHRMMYLLKYRVEFN